MSPPEINAQGQKSEFRKSVNNNLPNSLNRFQLVPESHQPSMEIKFF